MFSVPFRKGTNMELYIHIPFCVRKCAYCDFLSFDDRPEKRQEYGKALIRDLRDFGGIVDKSENAGPGSKLPVETVFIGGGTPSLMPEGFYRKMFSVIRECYSLSSDAEITIECNPGTVTPEKLKEYREAGINRVSFGAQSADETELRTLGRIHTWKDCENSVRLAREAGFDNISIDLMMNLPGQSAESFCRTIEKAVGLNPEHISAYSLILEEGTAFYDRYAEHPELLPDDDSAAVTYETAVRTLEKYGYEQYEISNFAKPGHACRHNIGYWKRAEYLGIGIGAASLIGRSRYRVEQNLNRYLQQLTYEPVEQLSKLDIRNETVMLGLRMKEGLQIGLLRELFGREYAENLERKLLYFAKNGLVERNGDRFSLTVRGMLVSNSVIAELID